MFTKICNTKSIRAISAATAFAFAGIFAVPVNADPVNTPTGVVNLQPGKALLPERTKVRMILDQDLKSGASKEGDEVEFETANDLYTPDRVLVAPAGTKAYGEVVKSSGHGWFGKGGRLQISCDYILAPDRTHIPLRGSKIGNQGKSDAAGIVAVTAFVSVLGVFINGRDVQLHKGAEFDMYVNQDTAITPYMATVAPNYYPNQTPATPAYYPTQAPAAPAVTKSMFALSNGQQVIGTMTAFDGRNYTVNTDLGPQQIPAAQVKSIYAVTVTPAPVTTMAAHE